MDIIYVIMLVFMTGSFCVISFLIGNGKNKITMNPIEAYKEHKEVQRQREEYDLVQRQNATMMDNINNYDGTSVGQKDIPNQ